MSQINSLEVATIVAIKSTEAVALMAHVGALSTTNKKGDRVPFERSLVTASLLSRRNLAASIYVKQIDAGRYGNLIRDVLAAGLVSKDAAQLANHMLIGAVSPSKEVTHGFCAFIIQVVEQKIANGKVPKGDKAYYFQLVRELHSATRVADKEPVEAE